MADCNHCYLQKIRSRAKQKGKKVTLRTNYNGVTSVYVHPRDVNIARLSESEREKYYSFWMLGWPNRCCC